MRSVFSWIPDRARTPLRFVLACLEWREQFYVYMWTEPKSPLKILPFYKFVISEKSL